MIVAQSRIWNIYVLIWYLFLWSSGTVLKIGLLLLV